MIKLKNILAFYPKVLFYYNIPLKHAEGKCLNVDFLAGVQGLQKKYMFKVYISSIPYHLKRVSCRNSLLSR